jgi:integrase
MPSMKLTKSAVDSARPDSTDYELRDTIVPGFLCKITPAGRKVFMLSYRTPTGERRKPSLGTYGQITVDQARKLAQDFLASVRGGADPSQERQIARTAPMVKDLADRFMVEHSEARNKPSTVRGNRTNLKVHVLPALGKIKVADVKRSDVADLVGRLRATPTAANHCLSLLRKMFNLAELWGLRPDGTNPCRHIKKYTGSKRTRLITDEELTRLYAYLDRADAEGLEHPILTLAIRLQFEFAARMSEVLLLEWKWIDFANKRVVWPDSKTGGMSKPLSVEAIQLLRNAPRYERSKFVVPALFDGSQAMTKNTYWAGWKRILERAGLPHCGTHAVRHRAATDIANSGVPVKVGMALTAHKTVTMFMRYVHTEDDPIRAAAEAVAARRRSVVAGGPEPENPAEETMNPPAAPPPVKPQTFPTTTRAAARPRPTKTALGNYRPYRGRHDEGRSTPPKPAARVGVSEEVPHV